MPLSVRRLMVDGHPTGLRGLDELFAALHGEGWGPDDAATGTELVQRAGEENYIPAGARDAFAAALLDAYHTFVAAHTGHAPGAHPAQGRDYGTWRGYPREQIPWYPTINLDLCDGCGRCLRLCSPKALAPTADGKVDVADPFRCIVGCSSCARVCKPKAITFPPREMLAAYRIK